MTDSFRPLITLFFVPVPGNKLPLVRPRLSTRTDLVQALFAPSHQYTVKILGQYMNSAGSKPYLELLQNRKKIDTQILQQLSNNLCS